MISGRRYRCSNDSAAEENSCATDQFFGVVNRQKGPTPHDSSAPGTTSHFRTLGFTVTHTTLSVPVHRRRRTWLKQGWKNCTFSNHSGPTTTSEFSRFWSNQRRQTGRSGKSTRFSEVGKYSARAGRVLSKTVTRGRNRSLYKREIAGRTQSTQQISRSHPSQSKSHRQGICDQTV